jgi:cytochrome d ubiquinol oxidase subunit II
MDLNTLWFILLGVLLGGYAILDGFDLGVGIVYLAARGDENRRVLLNSIGPIWDGNEVWLVTFGGALFAAFPNAYATAFSGLYLAFMLLLLALISRAVSIEFRGKHHKPGWRGFFDVCFAAGSTLATLLFGVAVGNAMIGIPIRPVVADGMSPIEFVGNFFDLLGVYPIMVGLLAVALMAMHGSIYAYLKTEGELQERVHGWVWRTFGFFLVMYLLTTIYTLVKIPSATAVFRGKSFWPWLVVVLNVLAIANVPRGIFRHRPVQAFLSSCATIAAFVLLFGVALFPNLIASSIDPQYNLTIYNAASSQKTLTIMAIIAAIGMPFVLCYTAVVYWTFRGKVQLTPHSY